MEKYLKHSLLLVIRSISIKGVILELKFIYYPRYVERPEYDSAIGHMVEKLSRQTGVVSIFQFGNINTPGISDIDILVVFKDGVECHINHRQDLSELDRYLFSHSLYGVSKTDSQKASRYTFFHNYNLLWGEELSIMESDLPKEDIQALKTQTAFEFLIHIYINMTVRQTYGIFSVVGLLRHVKALKYDLEFLNFSSGNLFDLIEIMMLWRSNWFKNKPNEKKLKTWIDSFYLEFTEFLKTTLRIERFYIPEGANLRIARNITLVPSEYFGYVHNGVILPSRFGGLGRKYFNLQHRFNVFRFQIPMTLQKTPDILKKRFEFFKEVKSQNSIKFPYFTPMTSDLNIL